MLSNRGGPPRLAKVLAFSLVMVMIASITDGVMDKLQFHYGSSIFARAPESWQDWLNPALSWHNKWKNGEATQGEVFPLSSTALVCVTDAWHFCKALTISFLALALIAPFRELGQWSWRACVVLFFGLNLLYGVVFETVFRWL